MHGQQNIKENYRSSAWPIQPISCLCNSRR